MTVKRDFKRRVRLRQARTGESYVTARRHLLAARALAQSGSDEGDDGDAEAGAPAAEPDAAAATLPGEAAIAGAIDAAPIARATPVAVQAADSEPDEPDEPAAGASGAVPVVELVDVSDEAKRVGLVCPIVMFPSLAERFPPGRVLARLRALLVATVEDAALGAMAGLALAGRKPQPRKRASLGVETLRQFVQRAYAGLGGVSDDGAMLAFHVAEGDGMVPILCTLGAQDTALVLSVLDDLTSGPWGPIGELLARRRQPGPPLFVVHEGRRHPITRDRFVIGRNRATSDLAIIDGRVSKNHAAVLLRNGSYYLKDLGSTHGIRYKGMRIDNKRIEEGDVFQIADYELRFTFEDE